MLPPLRQRHKMGIMKLCATPIRYVATLREQKKGMLRSSRLKMSIFWFAQPKCLCDFANPKNQFLILRDPRKVFHDRCHSHLICYDFERTKICATLLDTKKKFAIWRNSKTVSSNVARPKWFVRLGATRVEVCDWCFDRLDSGSICFDRPEPRFLSFNYVAPRKNISTKLDQRNSFRLSSTKKYSWPRRVSTEINDFDCPTQSFSRPRNLRPKKAISTLFGLGKRFQLSLMEEFLQPSVLVLYVSMIVCMCV